MDFYSSDFWLAMFSGVFWLFAYILIIYRGFKDKSYGMPIVALCGNFAWEVIFGLGIETGCPASWAGCPAFVIQTRNFIWLLFDVVILITVLKYGRRYFNNPSIKKYYTWIVLGGIVVSFLIIYTVIQEFWVQNMWGVVVDGQIPDFLPLKIQGGSYYTGFGLNMVMSLLYIVMIVQRGNVEGQSVYIALNKWLGSLAAYGFMVVNGVPTPVVNVLYGLIFVFDLLYTWLVYKYTKMENLSPWRRA